MTQPHSRPSLLIVDDTPVNIQILIATLQHDYELSAATSGQRALKRLALDDKPDLILLDIMMPDMDGYEVCATLKQDAATRDIPVIFVTAKTDAASEARGLALGAVDFIHKPFTPALVRARLGVHLRLAQQRVRLAELNHRHEHHLREVALLELAVRQSFNAVLITDADFDHDGPLIQFCNPAFCELTGYTRAELMGQSPRILQGPETDRTLIAELKQCLLDGRQFHGSTVNYRKDGQPYRVEWNISPVHGPHGHITHYISTQQNITARFDAEQELARARALELETGALIQKQLLFGELPAELQGFALACGSEASQGVDGDFYTFTQLGPSCFEILTGDVMGKGLKAAMTAAGAKNAYSKASARLSATRRGGMHSLAELVNAIHADITPKLIELGTFVTMSLLRFDDSTRTVTWVNAGHMPTLLAPRDGREIIELVGMNLPLGILESEVYEQHVTPFEAGDTLLLYSDGVSESVDAQQLHYGEERLKQALARGLRAGATPQALLDEIRRDLEAYTQGTKAADDRTAIIIQARAPASR